MPTSFTFGSDTIDTDDYLSLSDLSRGEGAGIDRPRDLSAIALDQGISPTGDVDLFAMTLIEGQTYTIDIDDGAGDGIFDSVDLELAIFDQKGQLVREDDGSNGTDSRTDSGQDPRVTFTADETMTVYVAVFAQEDEYIDGTYRFDTGQGFTGDYSLIVSTGDIPGRTFLTSAAETRAYDDGRQNIVARDGDDNVFLLGGDDLGAGGAGDDELFGGGGSDELSGNDGQDRLKGGGQADVLIGGDDADRLFGGFGSDALNGSKGDDRLSGNDQDDTMSGDSGRDTLFGDTGDDFLRGGTDVDVLFGGGGSDIFHFRTDDILFDAGGFDEDRIRDFQEADKIDLSDILLGELEFRGTGTFTGQDQVRISDLRNVEVRGEFGYQEVQINLDDDSTAERAFLVDTRTGELLDREDFIL